MSVKNITKEQLENVVKECRSYRQVATKFGLYESGSNIDRLKKKIVEYNLDVSHFTGKYWSKGITALEDNRIRSTGTKFEEVFCENSKASPGYVKSLLIKKSIIEYRCHLCPIVNEWNGKPLSLQMDHINGIRNDHRIENLRFVCPNCHSQTDTYCVKNKKNKSKPTKEDIVKALQETYSIRQAIDYLGVNNSNRKKILSIKEEFGIQQKQKPDLKKCLNCDNKVLKKDNKFCCHDCSANYRSGSTEDPSTWKHGTKNTYSYRKCRCDLCKKANTENKKQQRVKRNLKHFSNQ